MAGGGGISFKVGGKAVIFFLQTVDLLVSLQKNSSQHNITTISYSSDYHAPNTLVNILSEGQAFVSPPVYVSSPE